MIVVVADKEVRVEEFKPLFANVDRSQENPQAWEHSWWFTERWSPFLHTGKFLPISSKVEQWPRSLSVCNHNYKWRGREKEKEVNTNPILINPALMHFRLSLGQKMLSHSGGRTHGVWYLQRKAASCAHEGFTA